MSPTNTAERIVDVAKLPDPHRHPRVLEARAEAERLGREKLRLEASIDQARTALARAESAERDRRVQRALGNATEDAVRTAASATERARKALAELERDAEAAGTAQLEAEALVGPVLDAALDEAKAAFHAAYAALLGPYLELLAEASEYGDRLEEIYDRALQTWGVSSSERTDGKRGKHPSFGGLTLIALAEVSLPGGALHRTRMWPNKSKLQVARADAREKGWIE